MHLLPLLRRCAWLVGFAAWIAFIAIGLARAETNIEDFFPWLPDDTPARNNYVEFIRLFGADDVLIVSWEGCELGDPRVERLTHDLLTVLSERVRAVTTAEGLLEELEAQSSGLSRAEVLQRITNVLVGPDGRTTCLFVHLTAAGMHDRRGTVDRIIREARRSCGLEPRDLKLGGHPYVGYYSAEQTRHSIIWLSIPVAIVSTLLAWLCLRRKRLMSLVLACGGMAALTSLAMVPWAGYRVNGLLSALPSLTYVITTSGVIHIVNYSLALLRADRDAGRVSTPEEHAAAVRGKAWKACVLSCISAMIGTLSLVRSDFPAIREFGWFGMASVVLTLFIHLWLLPLLLAWVFSADSATVHEDPFERQLSLLLDWVLRWKWAIIGAGVVGSLVLVWPLLHLEGRFTLDRMFRPQSSFVQNVNWLEQHVGPIDATEVLVRFHASDASGFFRRIRRIQELEAALAQAPGVVSTFSTVTLVPPLREHANVVELILMRRLLEQRRGRLVGGSHLVESDGDEVWRITLRSHLFGGLPRNELMRGIRSRAEQTRAGWEESPEIVFTGGSQIFYETQHDVLRDFAQNLISAYAMIFVMNSIVLRNLRAGLLSMLPNIVPCLTVFGLLGWIDNGVDIGMTVAGCIALGIAVDNTAHFVLLYRETLRVQPTRERALRMTYRHAATSVFQTSIICGLSMLPYGLSDMLYLSRFGLVMSAMMFGAAFSDMLLTPSLIASRLGHCFDGRWTPPEAGSRSWPEAGRETSGMDAGPA